MNDTINRVIVPGTFDPITFGHIENNLTCL